MIVMIAEKTESSVIAAIIAIIWKTLSSDRSNHMETSWLKGAAKCGNM